MPHDEDWEEKRANAEARDKQWAEMDLAEANRVEEARADARAEEEGRLRYAEFADYEGDDYFVSAWKESPQFESFEAAVAAVQSTGFLCNTLGFGGLEYILSDKYATAGLRAHLIKRDKAVLRELAGYAKRRKPQGKPGRKEPAEGYWQDRVAELRAQGKSFGRIALELWGDSQKRSKASSLHSQVKKKAKKPPKP